MHEFIGNTPLDQEERGWNDNVLHVYPRTFKEERREGEEHLGVGSILGIISKLDWMRESGITAIWLGPIYESPGLDGNYDISNYYQVNPDLGNLDDVKELINEAHVRNIRVIFDLIPNHTSDQSTWFKSSSDPNNGDYESFKDYYIWRDPIEGELPDNIVAEDRLTGLPEGLTVPNNWTSIFSLPQLEKMREQYGGNIPEEVDIPAVTAWVWNEKRQQFYLAEFLKQQPTLNWANPKVREEIKNVVRFWLDLGIDGFRVDVINHIGKDPKFKNEGIAVKGTAIGEYTSGKSNPHDQWKQEKLMSHWPELGKYTKDLFSVLREEKYKDRNVRFILEDWISALTHDDRLDKLAPNVANVFNFETLLNTDRNHWSAKNFRSVLREYYSRMQDLVGALPNQVSGNHDTDTLRSRLNSPMTARAAYLLLASLPGALYTWQGDMMGRPNVKIPKELQIDAETGMRDAERVPIQWDSSVNGGFSRAQRENLWLPSVDKKVYLRDNLYLQARDPSSPYSFIQAILLRRKYDNALKICNNLRWLNNDNKDVLAFARADPNDARRQVISITNFSQNTTPAYIFDAHQTNGTITFTSLPQKGQEGKYIDLNKPIVLPPDASYLIDSVA